MQKSYPIDMLKECIKIAEEDFDINKEAYFKDILINLSLKSFFLYEFCEDNSFIKKLYSLEDGSRFDDNIQEKEEAVFDIMNLVDYIKKGECFFLETIEQLPADWIFEKEYFEKRDAKNIIAIPVMSTKKNDVKGFFLMESMQNICQIHRDLADELSFLGYLLIHNRKVSAQTKVLEFEINERNVLLDNSEVYMWYLLNANTFGVVNKSYAAFWGKTKEQIQFKSLYEVLEPDEAEKNVLENLEIFEDAQNTKKQRWYIDAKGRSRLLLVTYVPKFDINGNVEYVVCSAEDRTDVNRFQQDLIKARDEAEMSSLLKSRFLANMSHEIRTPLNGIVGFLDILEQTELNEEQKGYVDSANFACGGLLSVINDILDISKIEAGMLNLKKESFNLKNTIEDVISFWSLKAKEKELILNLKMGDDFVQMVEGDSQRLRQILNNLLSNAIKFTENGCIILRVKKVLEDEKTCKVLFKVEDTGIGLSDDDLKKLFEPFIQAEDSSKRSFGGTGLGLAISKDLVQMMGGELTVESKIAKGTIFSFDVEFIKQDKTNEQVSEEVEAKEVTKEFDLGSLKILMVEDNKINQKVACKIMEKNGMTCDIAQDGQQGLEAFKKGEYDLILMDCEMPVMDGYEATSNIRKIQNEYPKIPVIIAMTANAMDGEREKCINLGMDDYISKPINVKTLLDTIRLHFR